MKKALIAFTIVAMVVPAFAQKQKKEKTPKEVACPVMEEHKVNIKEATKKKMYADFEGRRYFFCCAGCKPAFEKEPAKFKSKPSIPTPKKK